MNGTNTTLRYDQRQRTEPVKTNTLEYLIPAQLEMSMNPSVESNETVSFPEQAEFKILTSDGRLCVNLGYQGNWVIEASLDNRTGDPNARLEGKLVLFFFESEVSKGTVSERTIVFSYFKIILIKL